MDEFKGFKFKVRDNVDLMVMQRDKRWYLGFKTGGDFIAVAHFLSQEDAEFTHEMLKNVVLMPMPEET